MINIPKIAEYMNIIGINIDTKEAARGAVSLVWNSVTYENTLAWSPEMLQKDVIISDQDK